MRLVARIGGASTLAIAAWAAVASACATGSEGFVDLGEGGLPGDGATGADRTVLPQLDSGVTPDTSVEDDSGGGTCTTKVVINEVKTGGSSAEDELVEIYNPNTCAVPMGGWKLLYRSSNNNLRPQALFTFPAGSSIAAKSFQFFGPSGTVGSHGLLATGMAANDGQVGLLDDTNKLVDGVAYGTATGDYREGAAAPSPPVNGSIGRKVDGVDTGDNRADWKTMTPPTPGAAN